MCGHIFISYKSEEKKEADSVRQYLEAVGIRCWMAPRSIPAGSNYPAEILRAIRESKCLVYMMSRRSLESKWIFSEIVLAKSHGIPVIPYQLEDIVLTGEMADILAGIQTVRADLDPENAEHELIRQIGKLPEKTGNSIPAVMQTKPDKVLLPVVKEFKAYVDKMYHYTDDLERDVEAAEKKMRQLEMYFNGHPNEMLVSLRSDLEKLVAALRAHRESGDAQQRLWVAHEDTRELMEGAGYEVFELPPNEKYEAGQNVFRNRGLFYLRYLKRFERVYTFTHNAGVQHNIVLRYIESLAKEAYKSLDDRIDEINNLIQK